MPVLMDQFWRAARVIRVVDGDTIDVEIDGGHRRRSDQRLRLLGIDTPELHSSDPAQRQKAIEAQSFVVDWLRVHEDHNIIALTWGGREIRPYNVRSEKGDSFDRWLADVQCQEGHDLGQALLNVGLAVVWSR